MVIIASGYLQLTDTLTLTSTMNSLPCVSVIIVQGRLFGHDGLPITEENLVTYGMLRCHNVAAIALLSSKALIHVKYIIDKTVEDS
jgi:hypothetical protein